MFCAQCSRAPCPQPLSPALSALAFVEGGKTQLETGRAGLLATLPQSSVMPGLGTAQGALPASQGEAVTQTHPSTLLSTVLMCQVG